MLKCEQITTLTRSDVRAPALGWSVAQATLRAVARALLRAIGVPVPLDPD